MKKALDLGKYAAQTAVVREVHRKGRSRDGVNGFGRRGILGEGGAGPERQGTAMGIGKDSSESSRIVSAIRVTAEGGSEGEAGAA
jgi:hypothetical protein